MNKSFLYGIAVLILALLADLFLTTFIPASLMWYAIPKIFNSHPTFSAVFCVVLAVRLFVGLGGNSNGNN